MVTNADRARTLGLRVVGSSASNRAMEAEVRRLARRLGLAVPAPVRPSDGTLLYPFDPLLAATLVDYARTPSRILWEVATLESRRLEAMYSELGELLVTNPPEWLEDRLGISVRVGPLRDPFAGPLQLRGTVKNAVIDAARTLGLDVRLEPEDPDATLFVGELQNGQLLVALDLAGRGQHERGYRLSRTEAPVRETLAAQAPVLARWHPKHEVLLDPMAGSGTFAIEAACLALGRPLWVPPKRPASLDLVPFRNLRRSRTDLFADSSPSIFASDRDPRAHRSTIENSRRAGVDHLITNIRADVRGLDASSLQEERAKLRTDPVDLTRGLIVANPPYGPRLGEDEAAVGAAHVALAELWRRMGDGWRALVLSGYDGTERAFGARPRMRRPVRVAKLKAHLYLFDTERSREPRRAGSTPVGRARSP
ncbi:MAG: hypothetical protein HYV07_24845 [Deltaproteobacteria bacterium]|nr:hypothetical protein [Deltaproteobacteria bacterium]